jgi:two-component system response regulator NreC
VDSVRAGGQTSGTVTPPPLSVIIADDHAVVRAGLRALLSARAEFRVLADVGTAADAVAAAAAHQPVVAVLDVTMPGATGIAVIGRIREVSPGTRVVILSMHANPEYARQAFAAGASGYLLKDTAGDELPGALLAIAEGGTVSSPAVAAALRQGAAPGPASATPLSGRERQVLRGIAAGMTNKEIAATLSISHRTVETHRENVMRKLGISSVPGLTRYAIDHGLTGPLTP